MIEIERLLLNTDRFISTLHVVKEPFGLQPEKDHIGMCINYTDLQELRDRFVEELVDTLVPFVYSPTRREELLRDLGVGGSDAGAWSALARRAKRKFRTTNLKGQFSEILLANLLQHYFKAAPLVRKMSLTTNPAVERHGADAFHVASVKGSYRIYIGEAKTYDRETEALKHALQDAVKDAVSVHFPNARGEMDLYVREEFLPAELEELATQFVDGTLEDVEVHIVCIATFRDNNVVDGRSRTECLTQSIDCLRRECSRIRAATMLAGVPEALVPRLNYILFPVREMDALLSAFQRELGTV